MYEIANRTTKELSELFKGTVDKRSQFNEAIVEKDFWVCIMLDYLFNKSKFKDAFTFKGGTSLSKAWNVIERFSEDIDLILDWRVLGYNIEEPWKERSKNKQDKFNKEANQRAIDFIGGELLKTLKENFSKFLKHEHSFKPDEDDPQTLLFNYPKIFKSNKMQQSIRLEIGSLAAWTPSEKTTVTPYTAEEYPKLFKQPSTKVRTVKPERTFWEKATILHQNANRPKDKPVPSRNSRHYYDLYRMAKSSFKDIAFQNRNLLEKVASFKEKFYPCSYAEYNKARIGTLRLIPPDYIAKDLKADYAEMDEMIYGKKPNFKELLKCISFLEKEINGLERQY